MFTLRSVARRAPRSASQFTLSSIRSASKPTLQSVAKPIISSRHPAHFSTSAWRSDNIGQELAAKLESEISIESENSESSTDSDSNVNSFIDQSEWTVRDVEGEQDVLLEKSYDDETITVSFSIADFNSQMMPEEEADEAYLDEEDEIETGQSGGGNTKGAINQGRTSGGNIKVAPEDSIAPADREELRNEEDDDFNAEHAFPANVNVLIQRPSKSGALRIHLVTDGTGFTIHSVTHLPTSSSSASASELLQDTRENTYVGPPFQQLDEEVQTMLEQYLDARGINTHLAMFIPDYIDVKEQKEYLAWLGRMKEFVE